MSKSNEREPQIAVIPIGSAVSTTNAVYPGLYFRKHSRIKNVYFVDQAGITLSPSNYQVVTLQDNTTSPVAYAAVATSTTAAVANTQLPLVFTNASNSTNSPELDVPAGTMLNVKVVGTGSAVLTKATLIVEHYPL